MSDGRLGGIWPSEHALTNWQSEARALKAQIESLQREKAAYEALINDDGSLESHEECICILTDYRDAYEKLGAVEALYEQIRNLQRENAQLVEINSMYESAMATDRQRIKELRAAAITPEMREIAAEYAQHERHEPLRLFLLDIAGLNTGGSDLLGEQG